MMRRCQICGAEFPPVREAHPCLCGPCALKSAEAMLKSHVNGRLRFRKSRRRHKERAVLRKRGYATYLLGRHWRKFRRRVILDRGGRCECCGDMPAPKQLQVHHRNYHRIGRERMSDVILLCGRCHLSQHPGPASRPTDVMAWGGLEPTKGPR